MSDIDLTLPPRSLPIPATPGYRVDDSGVVFSCHRQGGGDGPWHVMRPYKLKKTGYLAVDLMIDGVCCHRLVHRLVLEAFVGPCPPGLEACHAPGVERSNCEVKHLRWDTHKSNMADKVASGTYQVGEKGGNSVLKETDIHEVFHLSHGGMSMAEIAKVKGVCMATIANILRRKTWKNVDVDPMLIGPGGHAKGERSGNAKLSASVVIEMFRLSSEGLTAKRIAEIVGVCSANVSSVLRRNTWSHVPIPPEYLPRPRAT